MTYKNCPPVLESYLRYLKTVQNAAPKTIEARYWDIKCFLQFIRFSGEELTEIPMNEIYVENMSTATVAAVTEDDIYDYLDHLTNEQHLSGLTVQRRVGSIRMLYEYIYRHQEELGVVLARSPVPEIKSDSIPTEPCRELTPSEISKVLRSIEGEAAVRDVAIVLLISTTGISIGELVKLRCEDYQEDTMLVAGRKVHLTGACQDALNAYLRDFRDPASEGLHDKTLFISRNYRRRLTARGVQKALQKHFDRAGVKATARDLRHTAVKELLKSARNECERSYIAGYLGYTSIKSLKNFHLPKPADTAPLPHLTENTWLNNIGRTAADE